MFLRSSGPRVCASSPLKAAGARPERCAGHVAAQLMEGGTSMTPKFGGKVESDAIYGNGRHNVLSVPSGPKLRNLGETLQNQLGAC